MKRLLIVLLLACAALLGVAAPAQAHNVLIGSDPKDGSRLAAGPGRIALTFDQPVRQGFAQISVTGPDGSRWEDGKTSVSGKKVDVAVRPLGPAGQYVVGYRILSSDGHPVSGKVTFTLTSPGPGTASQGEPAAAATAPQRPDLSAQAAEAAQNGGAGMAVLWIAVALVMLAGATVVALRRTGGQGAPR